MDASETIAKVPIAALYENCKNSFDKLLQNLEKSTAHQAVAQGILDEFGRFRVWAGNAGAQETGRASLDYRLREASHIYDELIKLLGELDRNLEKALKLIEVGKGDDTPHSGLLVSLGEEFMAEQGPLEDEEPKLNEFESLVSDTTHIITCLYKFSIAIQNPAPKERLRRIAPIDVSYFEQWDIKHVNEKFHRVDPQNFTVAKYLSERLGKANTRRRQILRYYEAHSKKLSPQSDGPSSSNESTNTSKLATPIVEDSSDGAPEISDPERIPTFYKSMELRSQTTVSTIEVELNETVEIEVDEDDRLSQTSYATPTTHTMGTRVPSVPNAAFEGGPFECPYCFNIINIGSRQDWKKHVFEDLQPYVCTFLDCPNPDQLYSNQHEWFDHEVQVHRREWYCDACSESFLQKIVFQEHLEARHPEIVTRGYFEAVISRCERAIATNMVCPLCGANSTLQTLGKHLGLHLQEVALFALPGPVESSSKKKSMKGGYLSKNLSECLDLDSKSKQSVWDQRVFSPVVGTAATLSKEHSEKTINSTSGLDQSEVGDKAPLHLAASSGNVKNILELLQKNGEELEVESNVANPLELTPLHRAAAKGQEEVVKTLLCKGASVNLGDVSGRTALHYAVFNGDMGVVQALLGKRANPAAVDIHGRSPLHIAAAAANIMAVQKLIESGDAALPMITDKDGRTALDLVIDKARLSVIQCSPLEHASSDHTSRSQDPLFNLYDLIRELLSTEEGRIRGWSPLHFAVHSGEIPIVETLLKLDRVMNNPQQQLLNSKDKDGVTPLHVAACAGHVELVKLLMKSNCDLYCQDTNHEGALMLAVKHERADVVEAILREMQECASFGGGGDVVSKEKNALGITPLHWAAAHGKYGLVVMLVQLGGAELTTVNKLGMTALHYAALMGGHTPVAEFLLQQNIALADATDMTGDTPLHCAAAGGRIGFIKLLFDKFSVQIDQDFFPAGYNEYLRSSIMQRNKAGETALHCAAKGMVSSQLKRMMTSYDGTILESETFMKLESTPKICHKNVISRARCFCSQPHVNEIIEEEFDCQYQGSCQWQNELMKPLFRLNGDNNDAIAVVLLLLKHGADIEACDTKGRSPLHLAARWGRLTVAESLLQRPKTASKGAPRPDSPSADSPIWKKANVHVRDIHGDTPLHLAARRGYEDIVKLLVDEGANVENENNYKQSPQEVAEIHLQFEVVGLLRNFSRIDAG